MRFRHWKPVTVIVLVGVVLCAAAYGKKDKEKDKRTPKAQVAKTGEIERKVKEAEVPEAALKMLKQMSRGAEITEFAEEIENGRTFYEGSWKTRSGANMDVLVTKAGALVEIEEEVNAKNVPASVLKAARKAAGKDAELACEKKTMIFYEIKFRTDRGSHELLLTPDGRRVEEEIEKTTSDEDGDDDSQKMKAKGNKKGDDKGNNEEGDDEEEDEDGDDEDADDKDADDEDDDDDKDD